MLESGLNKNCLIYIKFPINIGASFLGTAPTA